MLEQLILWISFLADPIAATVFLWLLLNSDHEYMQSRFIRAAVVIAVIGLYGQGIRCFVAIDTGIAPRDDELAWWFGKDLALILFSCFLVWDKFSKSKV